MWSNVNANPSNGQRQYLLREAALILIISYLLIFASTHNGLVHPTVLTISAVLMSLLTVIFFVTSQSGALDAQKPLLVLMLVLILASIFSIDPRRSFAEVWLIGISGFLFLSSAELVRRGWDRKLFVKVMLVVEGIIMLLGWMTAFQWYQRWLVAAPGEWLPAVTYRLPLPNFLSASLNALIMMACARILFDKSRTTRILLGGWLLSALGLLFLTSSRGGWLGTAAGLAVVGVLSIRTGYEQLDAVTTFFTKNSPKRNILLGLGVAALGFIGWMLYQQTVHPTHTNLLASRREFWIPAMNAFLESPVLGKGPYTFISQYLQYNSVPSKQIFVYSHSIYFDTLSGSGILGFAAVCWLFWTLVRNLWQRIQQSNTADRFIAIGGAAAFAAFCVHGLADSVHHTIPTSAWSLAILLGVVLSEPGSQTADRKRFVLPVWGLVLSVFAWVNIWQATPFYQAVAAANANRWNEAVQLFSEATRRDPGLSVAYQQQGLAFSVQADAGDDLALGKAVQSFEKAVQIDPYWGANAANLGALYLSQGHLEKAAQAFQKAVDAAPNSALFVLNLGECEEALGDLEAARQNYERVLKLRPQWREAYFWRQTDLRKQVIQNTSIQPQTNLSVQELETALQKDSTRLRNYLALGAAYIQAGEIQKAEVLLRKAELAFTLSKEEGIELKWLQAEIQAAKGDRESSVILGAEALDAYSHQGIYGPGSMGTVYYAELMYRRPEMKLELVPQMHTIQLPDQWGNRMALLSDWYMRTGEDELAKGTYASLLEMIPDYESLLKEE
jgi:tetratricopeptide (TPR) repeat protein/O-antigen ligase